MPSLASLVTFGSAPEMHGFAFLDSHTACGTRAPVRFLRLRTFPPKRVAAHSLLIDYVEQPFDDPHSDFQRLNPSHLHVDP